MAIHKIQVIYCDPHQARGEDVEGDHFRMTLNGEKFEVDLCEECQTEYLSSVRELLALVNKPAARSRGKKASGPDPAKVREWAEGAGYDVSQRGRIPADVLAAYEAATS